MCSKMADACLEGKASLKSEADEEVTDFDTYVYQSDVDNLHDASDEDLLGASTLAKIADTE
jgi:hypothetical protein